jgi:hypothetical protein
VDVTNGISRRTEVTMPDQQFPIGRRIELPGDFAHGSTCIRACCSGRS